MSDTAYIDVSEQTFATDVLQRSQDVPVVVDFWAGWCGPCRILGPILEKLASEADGSWTLAKVDVDANPGLAASFGIQGIPAVKAFKDGAPVAEFVGALPEAQVRQWLSQLGPSEADRAVEEGFRLEASGDVDAAAASYRKALELDPFHEAARSALTRIEVRLRSKGVDEMALRERLDRDPGDVDAATSLADSLAARGEMDAAFGALLGALAANSGDERERARKHLVSLFEMLAADHPSAVQARRRLSALIF